MSTTLKKSTRKNKKYMVLPPGSDTWIHFGDTRYQQYNDSTPLKLYTHLNHNDKNRRAAYKARHKKITNLKGEPAYKNKLSPAFWSWNYLW